MSIAIKLESYQEYYNLFKKMDINFTLLGKGDHDIERLVDLLIKIDSEYIFPKDQNVSLQKYAKKLIDNAYNFILTKENSDMGIISIYANNFVTKTAYSSSIGILPSFRGGKIAVYFVKFAIEFAKELGMEVFKAEVDKTNSKWLGFLYRLNFHIESETDRNTYIVTRNLNSI